jgi:hypothetical protein
MLRILVPLIVSFVITAGGATAISVLQAKRSVAAAADSGTAGEHARPAEANVASPGAADSAIGDSTAQALTAESRPPTASAGMASNTLPTASSAHPPANAPATATPAASGQPHPASPAAASTTGASVSRPADATSGVSAGATHSSDARLVPSPGIFVGGRISKIFASMPAKEAARILDQMADADIVQILGSVGDRKAAEILSLLPAPRAAAISKLVLANKSSDQ